MSLQKQQDFLARLFTDESLRRNFLKDAAKVGAENGLQNAEIEDLKAVLPEEIAFFAESLYWKRLREAEKFLPLTKNCLQDNFADLFREFSQNYNPQTVKKHLEDAIEFCKFLQNTGKESNAALKNIAKFEQTKLEFFGYGKKFAFCFLNFDVAKIAETLEPQPKKKRRVAVWLKIGGRVRHFIV